MSRIRNYKKKRWKYIVVTVITLGFLLVTGIAILACRQAKQYQQKTEILTVQLNSYRRVVYVASEKLPRGTVITKENVALKERYSDVPQEYFITDEDFGKMVAQDVEEGTCLTGAMLYSGTENVRQLYFSEAELPEHILESSRIDVRIRYKNAEDYVVLADKILLHRDSGSGIVLELTEEEILILASAISDSKLYEDTKLYVVSYPEYRQMEQGIVNYIANKEILVMLDREKTEGESRAALEERLLQE